MKNRLIFALSLIGLAVSVYLAYEYSKFGPIGCPLTGSGCETVRKSAFSSFFGISLPYYGLLFYLSLAGLSVYLSQSFNKLVSLARLIVSFFGFAFGFYLTFLEAFVIKAYCIWCLSSFIISLLIFLICLKQRRNY